ncbi:hypothetical protein JCM1840_003354 [Sporobolomyces johnsonii]
MLLVYIANSTIKYLSTSMAVYSVITCLTTLNKQLYPPWPMSCLHCKRTKHTTQLVIEVHKYMTTSPSKPYLPTPSIPTPLAKEIYDLVSPLNRDRYWKLVLPASGQLKANSRDVRVLTKTRKMPFDGVKLQVGFTVDGGKRDQMILNELSYSSLLRPVLRPIPEKSPLHPYLPSSTASFRMSAQVLLRKAAGRLTTTDQQGSATRRENDMKRKVAGLPTTSDKRVATRREKDMKRKAAGLPTTSDKRVATRRENDMKRKAAGLPTTGQQAITTRRENDMKRKAAGLPTIGQQGAATRRENDIKNKAAGLPTTSDKRTATLRENDMKNKAAGLPTTSDKTAATMTKHLVKGRESERDADTAFVAKVMDNLCISGLMGKVSSDDVAGASCFAF